MRAKLWITSLASAIAALAISSAAAQQQPPPQQKKPEPPCPSTGAVKNGPPKVTLYAGPKPGAAVRAGLFILIVDAMDPDGDKLLYTFYVTGGKVSGGGAEPDGEWNLGGVEEGSYTVTAEADDGRGCRSSASTSVIIERP
ncbi:hypothetical protein BH11PSE2_BH11PSE2_03220 [soil metagenome]